MIFTLKKIFARKVLKVKCFEYCVLRLTVSVLCLLDVCASVPIHIYIYIYIYIQNKIEVCILFFYKRPYIGCSVSCSPALMA